MFPTYVYIPLTHQKSPVSSASTPSVKGKRCFQKILALAFPECVGVNGVCEKLGKEIQREHAGMQVKSTGRESVLFFFRCFFNPRGGQTLEIPTQ
jgi:hypothetical protein